MTAKLVPRRHAFPLLTGTAAVDPDLLRSQMSKETYRRSTTSSAVNVEPMTSEGAALGPGTARTRVHAEFLANICHRYRNKSETSLRKSWQRTGLTCAFPNGSWLLRQYTAVGNIWPRLEGVCMNLTEAIAHLDLSDAVPSLIAAVNSSEDLIARMRSALVDDGAERTMDVVACGSLARREYTLGSDVDYLVIVNAMPEHPKAARELVAKVKALIDEEANQAGATAKDPGTSGLFARATGLFDVIERIGLQDDTNHTHTVRMEIVQESVSLLDPDLHAQILGRTIRRYLDLFPVPQNRPPRFLLNDMLRYWRQIAIDYQAKAPLGGQEAKAVLRHIKLVTTRKNLFASSVLPLIAPRDDSIPWAEYLGEIYATPPLARLAMVTQSAPESVRAAVRTIFSTIDLFIRLTDDRSKREHFEKLAWESRKEDDAYMEIRRASDLMQKAYEEIFLGEWSEVAENTRRYLLF